MFTKGNKYGRRFTKENSREMQLRSAESRNRNAEARNMFLRLASSELKNDDGTTATRQEVIADVIIDAACSGDLQAAKFFFEITDQMPEKRGNSIEVSTEDQDITIDFGY